ncbi:MAG: cytochrome c biogenesis protein [Mastigocoleus sp.]
MTSENSVNQNPHILISVQRFLKKQILPILTDLRLAIIMLLAIAVFSISGTVIEQGESLNFYQSNYPENPALFGFLTWKVILILGLDHVYVTWWFLALLILFGTSITACSFTRQLPALKAARRWKFYDKPRQFRKLALSAEFDSKNIGTHCISNLSQILQSSRYKVFQEQDNKIYARKGIVGRIGPIVVHIGIIIILLGSIWGASTGFLAQEMVPSGQKFQIKNIIESGILSKSQIPQDWSVKVNRFWIDYTNNGNIDQFYSDLSVLNQEGEEIDRQTIYVNKPLRYKGVTLYQTSWGIAAVKVRVNNSPIFELPMAKLNTERGEIWGTWIPTKPDLSEGVSLLAKDLQGTVLIYDTTGNLVNTLRAGMSAQINGVTLRVLEIIGSTGLQIKADPGIPIVYAGFALLMLGTILSYFSHSQIWVLQEKGSLYVGGKTNRAQVAFEKEVLQIFEQINSSRQADEMKLTQTIAS